MSKRLYHLLPFFSTAIFCLTIISDGFTQLRVHNLRLEPINYVSDLEVPPMELAFITFDMLPGTGLEYFNARFTNPLNNNTAWLIRNLPIPPISNIQTVSYIINQSYLGIEYPFLVCEYVCDLNWRVDSIWPPFETLFLLPVNTTYRVTSGSDDLLTIPPLIFPPVFFPPPPAVTSFEYRGCEVPNIDLDNQTFYPPGNTIPNDKNSCGPAAAGNSLEWLVAQHPELAGDTTTLREKVDKLKSHMKMQKNDPDGVRFDSMVCGKLSLIDELMLPIRVKYQTEHGVGNNNLLVSDDPRFGHFAENKGSAGMSPTFDFLKQEMEDGEDVELHVGWYNNNVRNGGHWYVVTGYFQADSSKGVWLKEDTDQDSMGGTRQEYFEWKVDSGGFPYLSGITTGAYGGHVESLVSESYDSTITFIDWTPFWSFSAVNYDASDNQGHPFDAYLSIDPLLVTSFSFLNVGATMSISDPIIQVIENMPLAPGVPSMGEYYLMDLEPVTSGSPVPDEMMFFFSIGPFQSDFRPNSVIEFQTDTLIHHIPQGAFIGYHPPIPNFTPIFLPPIPPIFPFPSEFRGCEVPNTDLDSLMYPFVADEPSTTDYCACGPAAAANSLEWLDLKHPEIDIPGDIRSTLDSLKRMMKLNKNVNPDMPDPDDFGVEYVDFIKAKLEFIDKYHLPIHVKYQSHIGPPSVPSPNMLYGHSATNENNPDVNHPEFSWLATEMEAGEDVEVMIGYYDYKKDTIMLGDPLPANHIAVDTIGSEVIVADTTMRERNGGHFVNVTGYADLGNAKWVVFKHDIDQDGPEGTISESSPWITDEENYSYFESQSHGMTRAYVETVVSESYDPGIIFCPDKVCIPDDDGDGSLRRALVCATEGDTIKFTPTMNGQTITLTSGPLIVDKSVVIFTTPGTNITLSGANVLRTIQAMDAVPIEIVALRLVGGQASQGAVILNEAILKLKDTQVINSQGVITPGLILNQNGGEIIIQGNTNVKLDD